MKEEKALKGNYITITDDAQKIYDLLLRFQTTWSDIKCLEVFLRLSSYRHLLPTGITGTRHE